MSKRERVYDAVIEQLASEGQKTDRLDRVMGDPPFRYSEASLDSFLNAVKSKLKNGQPSFDFTYDAKFVTAGLKQTVSALMGSVESHSKKS